MMQMLAFLICLLLPNIVFARPSSSDIYADDGGSYILYPIIAALYYVYKFFTKGGFLHGLGGIGSLMWGYFVFDYFGGFIGFIAGTAIIIFIFYRINNDIILR